MALSDLEPKMAMEDGRPISTGTGWILGLLVVREREQGAANIRLGLGWAGLGFE